MKVKTIEVEVLYKYTLQIDENDECVKEYETENDVLMDCAIYRFNTVLPVIRSGGVKVIDCELIEYN